MSYKDYPEGKLVRQDLDLFEAVAAQKRVTQTDIYRVLDGFFEQSRKNIYEVSLTPMVLEMDRVKNEFDAVTAEMAIKGRALMTTFRAVADNTLAIQAREKDGLEVPADERSHAVGDAARAKQEFEELQQKHELLKATLADGLPRLKKAGKAARLKIRMDRFLYALLRAGLWLMRRAAAGLVSLVSLALAWYLDGLPNQAEKNKFLEGFLPASLHTHLIFFLAFFILEGLLDKVKDRVKELLMKAVVSAQSGVLKRRYQHYLEKRAAQAAGYGVSEQELDRILMDRLYAPK